MKRKCLIFIIGAATIFMFVKGVITARNEHKKRQDIDATFNQLLPTDTVWRGAPSSQIPFYSKEKGKLIYYGYQLIANTAYYLGPKGKIARLANGLNCQNCHLDGGTRPFANNFGKVFATYPQYRARNNKTQSLYDRINDCMQRSMNGSSLDFESREMKAIYAYIAWLDKDVPKNTIRHGTKLNKIPLMDTAANVQSGKLVFIAKCQICHGPDGQGQLNEAKTGYTYPPLWGPQSYNDGAGMYRLTKIAAFVMKNMPYGTNYQHPALTIEQAWNVGAYVNSQPRPHYDQSSDWQQLDQKPIDFPFGPYKDNYSERTHKYGPYKNILKSIKSP